MNNQHQPESILLQLHGIMLLYYAEHNIDKSAFIDTVFAGETEMIRRHLKEKFEHRNFSIFDLIIDLDVIFRVKMIEYLLRNYKGFSLGTAEDYLKFYEFNTKPITR